MGNHKAFLNLRNEDIVIARYKDELNEDGLEVKGYKKFLNKQDVCLETQRGKAILSFPTGEVLEIPTRGLRVFPRRTILRIGMLLRDSAVAKEVKIQLLNIEERASNDTVRVEGVYIFKGA